MKNSIIFLMVCGATFCFFKACEQSGKTSNDCEKAAHMMAEKMYVCGMLRSYDGVARIENDLTMALQKRNVSSAECVTEGSQLNGMACRDYEMLVNTVIFQGK